MDHRRIATEVSGRPVRTLPFGDNLCPVTFLIYDPGRLVFVTKILWFD